jgi:hypothetical protein
LAIAAETLKGLYEASESKWKEEGPFAPDAEPVAARKQSLTDALSTIGQAISSTLQEWTATPAPVQLSKEGLLRLNGTAAAFKTASDCFTNVNDAVLARSRNIWQARKDGKITLLSFETDQ